MANTYTQIYVQIVFAVKFRASLLKKEWREELYKYITGIVQNHNHKMYVINGMADHIHIFVSMNPTQAISELVREVKRSSAVWINENKYKNSRFQWQKGFGAFTYNKSQSKTIIRYIENQEIRHQNISFKEEYLQLLKEYDIEFEEKYVFKDPK